MIDIHNLLSNVNQDSTAKAVNITYYRVAQNKVMFLIKLYEINH